MRENIADETRLYFDRLFQNKAEFYRWKHRRAGGLHYHEFGELCMYMGEKPFEYLVDDRKFTMHGGDLLYIPPMSIHCALVSELVKSEEYDRYVLLAEETWLRELLTPFPSVRPECSVQLATHGTKWEFIRELFEKGCKVSGKSDGQILANAAGAQIVTCMSLAVQEEAAVVRGNRQPELLLQAMEYINRHYAEDISLEQTAKVCHVSRSTLGHSFSRMLGISFNKYVAQKRMAETEHLLLQNVPLKVICRQVGYSDYPTFYRAFRKQYGMSPSEYCAVKHSGIE